MRWTIYKSSGLATFCSIIGALFVYAGILCLFAKEFLAAIICIMIGIGIQIGAGKIADNATFKKWKKEVVRKGYAQLIAQGDYSVAVQLYNQNPGERTLKYFETLNTYVASRIRSAVQAASGQSAAKPVDPVNSARQHSHSANVIRCAACGAELVPDSFFCTHCGRKVERVKKCLRCGNKLMDGAKFCVECGYQI